MISVRTSAYRPRFYPDHPKTVALLLQLGGALIITSVDAKDSQAQSKYNKGRIIAQIGVVIQLAGFGLFSILAVRFNFTSKRFIADFDERMRLASSDGSPALGKRNDQEYFVVEDVPRPLKKNWQTILLVTNISSAAILVSPRVLWCLKMMEIC